MAYKNILATISLLAFSTAFGCSSTDLGDLPTDAQGRDDTTVDPTGDSQTPADSTTRPDARTDAASDSVTDSRDSSVKQDAADSTVLPDTSTDTNTTPDTLIDTSIDSVSDVAVLFDTSSDTFVSDSFVDSASDIAVLPDTSMADTALDSSSSSCHLVINEVQTGNPTAGGAKEELIEIFNPCATSVTLNGWKLVYRSKNSILDAGTETVLYTFASLDAAVQSIAPNSYMLFTQSSYVPPGVPMASIDGTFGTGMGSLNKEGGGIALYNELGAIVDSMTYGDVNAAHPYTETAEFPTASLPSMLNESIQRKPNGRDTNNNSVDFQKGPHTPKAMN